MVRLFVMFIVLFWSVIVVADEFTSEQPMTESPGTVLGESADFIVVVADHGDSYSSLAARYLGDPRADWYLRKFNPETNIRVGEPVAIPRSWSNSRGVERGLLQTIPVLTYHRFREERDRLSVTPDNFRQQMRYLRDNGYYVARFSEFEAFLNGQQGLPPRTVLIAIDDGYQSTYHAAFPILKEFNIPAIVYVYSDYMNGGGLKTTQMQEMMASGLITFEAHSKTHSNLSLSDIDESHAEYKERIKQEVGEPRGKITKILGVHSTSFAYPYGAVNQVVLDEITTQGYTTAFTVSRGSVSAFDHSLLLRRSMIYGEFELEQFIDQLNTSETFEVRY